MKKNIFCLASTQEQAERIFNHLVTSGFRKEDISFLMADDKTPKPYLAKDAHIAPADRSRDVSIEERRNLNANDARDVNIEKRRTLNADDARGLNIEDSTKAPEGGLTGAVTGGLIGGALGLLAGIGSIAIPGMGAFIAAGPIMAALSGSGVGGGLGVVIGSLIGAGMSEYEVEQYKSALEQGNILLCVHTDSDAQFDNAKRIMEEEDAKSISSSREATGSST